MTGLTYPLGGIGLGLGMLIAGISLLSKRNLEPSPQKPEIKHFEKVKIEFSHKQKDGMIVKQKIKR